jgi:hypothetical protein
MEIEHTPIGDIFHENGKDSYILLTGRDDDLNYVDALEYAENQFCYDVGFLFTDGIQLIRKSANQLICIVYHRMDN